MKEYEKTTKFHIVFPIKWEGNNGDSVSHDKVNECLAILNHNDIVDYDGNIISFDSHEHIEKITYRINNDSLYWGYEDIERKLYNILIKNGLNKDIFEIKKDIEIKYENNCLSNDNLNNFLKLKDSENIRGYLEIRKFYTPSETSNSKFFEGYLETVLIFTKEFNSNPNTVNNKTSYRNRILKLSQKLKDLFPGIQVYVTSIECEYTEKPKEHSCIEKEYEL